MLHKCWQVLDRGWPAKAQEPEFYGLPRLHAGSPCAASRDAPFRERLQPTPPTIGLRIIDRATAILAAFMPPASPETPPIHAARWPARAFRLLMLLGACLGFVVVWVVLAWSKNSQCGWMALLAALDVAWILRLSGWPAGARRAVIGVAATAGIVLLANWFIIAVHLGEVMGLDPFGSALRLGLQHAWTLAQLANGGFEVAMIGLGLLLAAIASR